MTPACGIYRGTPNNRHSEEWTTSLQWTNCSSQRCHEWAENQVNGTGQRLKKTLPSCPCTESHAALPNSGFRRDTFTSYSMSALTSLNYAYEQMYGASSQRLLVDDSYQRLLHKNASVCYRQSNTLLLAAVH